MGAVVVVLVREPMAGPVRRISTEPNRSLVRKHFRRPFPPHDLAMSARTRYIELDRPLEGLTRPLAPFCAQQRGSGWACLSAKLDFAGRVWLTGSKAVRRFYFFCIV